MTSDGVYVRITRKSKTPHWLPHFVLNRLLLQEISYQTYINGVSTSLHMEKKGLWPPFSLSMGI